MHAFATITNNRPVSAAYFHGWSHACTFVLEANNIRIFFRGSSHFFQPSMYMYLQGFDREIFVLKKSVNGFSCSSITQPNSRQKG